MKCEDVLDDLARLGSIDAVLDEHTGLGRDDVVNAIHYAASVVAKDSQWDPISPLYRAYNGYMLGLFVGSGLLFKARNEIERLEETTHRVTEFLLCFANDSGAELEIPESADIETWVDETLRRFDEDIAKYYQLGLAAFRYVVVGGASSEYEKSDDLAEGQQLLQELGHPPRLFETSFEARIADSAADETPSWQEMMSTCLRLAREMVAGLPEEHDTCFVALRFAEPYESRYMNFYRAIAHRSDRRAIRAWGGLGQEEHQELLLALIAKSGAVLADVTEPNANVALEVGFAMGAGKTALMIAEGEKWQSTANIQMDWVFPYEASEDDPDWVMEAAEKAGLYFTALDALRRSGPIPSWSAKPIEALQFLADAMASKDDKQ